MISINPTPHISFFAAYLLNLGIALSTPIAGCKCCSNSRLLLLRCISPNANLICLVLAKPLNNCISAQLLSQTLLWHLPMTFYSDRYNQVEDKPELFFEHEVSTVKFVRKFLHIRTSYQLCNKYLL